MRTVVGIDVGTQSVKVVFYDFSTKEIVAAESASLDLYQNEKGVAEQQVHWWLNAVHEAFAKVGTSIRQTACAIGVSGQQHGMVALDASGNALIPVKLWCDTSCELECSEIMDAVGGEDACIEISGNAIMAGYTVPKLRWFAKNHPSLYDQLDCILLPHDYMNFYLTGERCMEMGDASGTGFLNVRTRTWSQEILRAVDPSRDLRACLPELRTQNEPVGQLLPKIAEVLGLPAGIPVSIGGGDNMMGAIGTGNVTAGTVTMSLGTSGTVYAYADKPVVDAKGRIAAFCSSTGGWLPLLCTMNCTVTSELLRHLLGVDLVTLENDLKAAPRGAGGVLTLPFFNGERTPNLPNAKGCILGLDGQNCQRENILRSGVEGATFALKFGIDALDELGIDTREIVLTGGGARSATWRQIVADICGIPVTVLKQTEGAAFGAALQALALLEDQGSDLAALTSAHLTRDDAMCHEPDPSAVQYYSDIYHQYQRAVSIAARLYT